MLDPYLCRRRVAVINKSMQNMRIEKEGHKNGARYRYNVQPGLLNKRVAGIDKSTQSMMIGQDDHENNKDNVQPRLDGIVKSTQNMITDGHKNVDEHHDQPRLDSESSVSSLSFE